MKLNLKELVKKNKAKLAVAIIVPGGFIALAAYELGKYIGRQGKDDNSTDTDSDSAGDMD